MIDIYDDVLEEHNAILVDDAIKQLSWKYDYSSQPNKPNKHWHILCGHNKTECTDAGFDWAHSLFQTALNKYEFIEKYDVDTYLRIYMNAHTHGIEPHFHHDDGDFTMIYYPRLDWKLEYGGGTYIDGKLAEYKGNRLVVFDASLLHSAMPVSRECYQLRTCVVFKCSKKNSNVNFFRNAIKGKSNFEVKSIN
jgi:hypothetical protein